MSEFTNTKDKRLTILLKVAKTILQTGSAREFIVGNKDFIETVIPTDFITLFDVLIKEGYPMDDIKVLTNKILNVFHQPIENFERIIPAMDSFLGVLEQNNREMELLLKQIKPVFKDFVLDVEHIERKKKLLQLFRQLEVFVAHYTIKENVLFPVIEKNWSDYRCLLIMWSFHDDIRKNIKTVIHQLSNDSVELKTFKRCVGDIFFNMLAIKFREERILFPYILSTISEEQLAAMNREGFEMGYPYVQPAKVAKSDKKEDFEDGKVNLGTGELSVEQLKLIFNHLPVDITYVDEHDKVRYFSTPPKRIFPRTKAIIGRQVNNCHPPESVHVVENIVRSFRSGEKSRADFWIKMRGEYILIQYFAVRNEQGEYKGVIEVSQEISDIRKLEGEKRLLDW
ncbi:DUF438 domain-containing protein [Saccharicrinis sp. 156]|uniref:DUF438 domain-containing protein n=1 Tax=Saccharicrinis sp. 156 TaxID=3417574 RepID=UPI003D33A661